MFREIEITRVLKRSVAQEESQRDEKLLTVSEHKRAEEALQEEVRISAALARVGQEMLSSLTTPVLLDRLCQLTAQELGCDCSYAFLRQPEADVFRPAVGWGDTPEQWEALRALNIPRQALARLLARLDSEDMVEMGTSAQDLFLETLLLKFGITTSVHVALRRGGEIIGIQSSGYRGRRGPFTTQQRRIAGGIAQIASLALENAWLFEQVESGNRLKSDFLATISHKLRTPLHTIMGYNDLLLEGGFGSLTAEQAGILRRVERSARGLCELINATLEVDRLERLVQGLRRDKDQLLAENAQLWKEVEGRFATQNLVGMSAKLRQVVQLVEQVRDSSVDVLITGESGTGKELMAKAIHYTSPRARRPWVVLNCAALPDSLVESELFGIEKGVATGVERRVGKFEAANGGTLFLDEIGDLSLMAQAKILRVLQERMIERVGGRKAIPVDVRIVTATNKDLAGEIWKGTFRADLYYRLSVIHVHMPPLREIREDIPLLAHFFLDRYCREMKQEPKALTAGALRCLVQYPWPGNVRELGNEMRRLVTLTRGKVATEGDLSEAIRNSGGEGAPARFMLARSLKEAVVELEKRLIHEALHLQPQNQRQAARALGLSRQGLIKKIKRYGLKAS